MGAVRNALQALPFPLRLRLFRPAPPPRPPTPPSEGRGRSGESEGVPYVGSHEVSSPPSRCSVGEEGVGAPRGPRLLGGTSGSAASSLTGVGVTGSSCSQESLVLADPSPVASSVSAGHDRRSRSREIREYTRGRSCSCSSRSYPSRGRDSREGRRCARLRSGGGGRVTGLASCALVPRTVCGLVDEGALAMTRHAPLLLVCGLGGPGPGLRTATGPVRFACSL